MTALNLKRVVPILVLLFAAGLLAGCETTADATANAGESGPVEAPETAALPPETEIDDDPRQLIGLVPAELRDLLGEPDLVRRETPAQVWQYRGGVCVLDMVLYPEAEGDRVTYVEARNLAGAETETRPCLHSLLRDRLAASG